MITMDEMQRLLFSGGDVVGPDGKKIGGFGQLFLDAATGQPAWATVTTGLFGSGESFVPLTGAEMRGDDLAVAFDKGQVKHAPRTEGTAGHLSPDEERALYRHYGLLHDDDDTTDDRRSDDTTVQGHDDDGTGTQFLEPPIRPIGTPAAPPGVSPLAPPGTQSATTGSADLGPGDRSRTDDEPRSLDQPAIAPGATPTAEGMVLRAEQAKVVGTEHVPTERVRMRRYTVTEEKQVTVPVTREEFRLEDEPTDATGGAAIDDPARHRAGDPADRPFDSAEHPVDGSADPASGSADHPHGRHVLDADHDVATQRPDGPDGVRDADGRGTGR